MKLYEAINSKIIQTIKKAESLSERDSDIAAYMLRNLFEPHSDLWNIGYDLVKNNASENDIKWYIEQIKKHFKI